MLHEVEAIVYGGMYAYVVEEERNTYEDGCMRVDIMERRTRFCRVGPCPPCIALERTLDLPIFQIPQRREAFKCVVQGEFSGRIHAERDDAESVGWPRTRDLAGDGVPLLDYAVGRHTEHRVSSRPVDSPDGVRVRCVGCSWT